MGAARGAVSLCDRKRQKAKAHNRQVAPGGLHRRLNRAPSSVRVQIQSDQELAARHKDSDSARHQQYGHDHLQAESVPDPLVVFFSAVLRGKDSDARQSAEHAEIPHK